MKHEIHIEGYAFALRPVQREDAPLIVQLRTDPSLNRYLHPTSPNVEDQESWLDRYFAREGDYYFVIEDKQTHEREGVVGIYNVDAGRSAEWGRWILRPHSVAAIESAWLIYSVAFEKLGLDEVYCRTMVENGQAVSFHQSCGLEDRSLLPRYLAVDTNSYDALEQVLTRTRWPLCCERLSRQAQRIAARLVRAVEPAVK